MPWRRNANHADQPSDSPVSTVSIAYVPPVPYQINFYLVNTNNTSPLKFTTLPQIIIYIILFCPLSQNHVPCKTPYTPNIAIGRVQHRIHISTLRLRQSNDNSPVGGVGSAVRTLSLNG